MIYLENIYLYLVAPLLVACFCIDKIHRRALIFFAIGMTACLFGAYINTFLAQLYGVSVFVFCSTVLALRKACVQLL